MDQHEEVSMSRSTRVAGHMSAEEIKTRMHMTSGFLKMQKWLVVYNAIVDPRPVPEIAKHTGLSEASVYRIIAEYNELGPEALDAGNKVIDQSRHGKRPKSVSM
jgi:hypothetical protein